MSKSENAASPAARYLIRSTLTGLGNPDSLANVNTIPLPDGCCCWVISDQSLWALDKSSSGAAVPNERLVPSAGPGRWIRVVTASGVAGAAAVTSTNFNAFAVDTNWGTSSGSAFSLESVSSPAWALTALGGILTYTGPTRTFLVGVQASARVTNADAVRDVFIGVDKNGDLVGAPSPGTSSAIDTTIAGVNADIAMATSRLVNLASGDTVRTKMAGPAAALALSAMIRMTVTPAG